MKKFLALEFAVLVLVVELSFFSTLQLDSDRSSYTIFEVASVSDFNAKYYDLRPHASQNGSQTLTRLLLDRERMIEQSVNMTAYDVSYVASIVFQGLQGFVISKRASPLLLFSPQQVQSSEFSTGVVFGSPGFNFLDESGRPVGPSCADYLKAYFNLNDSAYEKANLSQLVGDFRGPFSTRFDSFHVDSGVSADRHVICPLVFKDADIEIFNYMKLENTAFRNTVLKFEKLDKTFKGFRLNSRIDTAVFTQIYRVRLDESILNAYVYETVYTFSLAGVLTHFDEDLFKPFNQLKILFLLSSRTGEFFHSSDNKWLRSLNYEKNRDPRQWRSSNASLIAGMQQEALLLGIDSHDNYVFPDEDFCLFKHHAHSQLVLAILTYEINVPDFRMSCSLLYLLSYSYPANVATIRPDMQPGMFYHDDYSFDEMKLQCQFDERLRLCNTQNLTTKSSSNSDSAADSYTLAYTFKWLELVGPVLTFPLISLVGFALNLVICLVIGSHKSQTSVFKGERLFTYMKFVAVFNMLECFVCVFLPMIECVEPNSIYCSSMTYTPLAYAYGRYIFGYFGESMKTCSIIISLAFSVERFCVTHNCDKLIFKKFVKIELSKFVPLVLIISFVSSIPKIFQVESNSNYKDYSMYSIEAIRLNLALFQGSGWFQAAFLAHYLLNDLVLILVNLAVDVALIRVIRQDLSIKARVKQKLECHSSQLESTLKSVRKTQRDTNKMIVYSFLVYLLCRLPELAFSLFLFFVVGRGQWSTLYLKMCVNILCTTIENVVQYAYMFSYTTNIYFYYKFNKPFRAALKTYFGRAA